MSEHRHHHDYQKPVIDRLSRVEGHVRAVKKMVQEEEDCNQILIQISAIRSALNEVGKIVLTDHIRGCVVTDVRDGELASMDQLESALKIFLK